MQILLLICLPSVVLSLQQRNYYPKYEGRYRPKEVSFSPSPKLNQNSWRVSYYLPDNYFSHYRQRYYHRGKSVNFARNHATFQHRRRCFYPLRGRGGGGQNYYPHHYRTIHSRPFQGFGKVKPQSTIVYNSVKTTKHPPPDLKVISTTTTTTAEPATNDEDNLVLDFSQDGGPTFVESTVQSPPILEVNEFATQIAQVEFSILLDLVNRTNLGTSLSMQDEGITVFAPSNAAFERFFGPGELEALPDDQVAELIARHVIFGVVTSNNLADDKVFTPTNKELEFERDSETGRLSIVTPVGPIRLLRTDIQTDFGVVHVIESVLPTLPK